VLPFYVRPLNRDFSHGRWLYIPQCFFKILPCDLDLVQYFSRNLWLLKIDLRQYSPKGTHGCLLAQGFQVGSDKAVCYSGDCSKIDILCQRHSSGMYLQDFKSSLFIRNSNFNFPIKPSWSAQSGVNSVRPVCSTDNY